MPANTPVFNAELLGNVLRSYPVVSAYVVGFSGGADSTALLHALSQIQCQLDVPVSAIHVNHGLHAQADLWQSACESFCHQHGIDLRCFRIDLQNHSGKGLEAEARRLRYKIMSAELEPGACLLTAHHADDQAETLLLNLMRGSGVDGLSGMPESRPLGHGLLQRPLLKFPPRALRQYLRQQGIKWIQDPSNDCLNHDRNFVRHEVMPLLESRWPSVCKRLQLTHSAMSDTRYILEDLANSCVKLHQIHPRILNVSAQLDKNPALFKLAVRHWVRQSGASSIPACRLETLYEQAQQTDNDHSVAMQWDGWLMRLYQRQLWLYRDTNIGPCPQLSWSPTQPEIDLGEGLGKLVLQDDMGNTKSPAGSCPVPVPAEITANLLVGSRIEAGNTSIRQGAANTRLKTLFQAANIPPWLRNAIPLCTSGGELLAVGDWCFDQQFASRLSERNLRLCWYPVHPLLQYIRDQQHQCAGKMVDPVGVVR